MRETLRRAAAAATATQGVVTCSRSVRQARTPDVVLGLMPSLFLCILMVLSIPALQSETLKPKGFLAQLRLVWRYYDTIDLSPLPGGKEHANQRVPSSSDDASQTLFNALM